MEEKILWGEKAGILPHIPNIVSALRCALFTPHQNSPGLGLKPSLVLGNLLAPSFLIKPHNPRTRDQDPCFLFKVTVT